MSMDLVDVEVESARSVLNLSDSLPMTNQPKAAIRINIIILNNIFLPFEKVKVRPKAMIRQIIVPFELVITTVKTMAMAIIIILNIALFKMAAVTRHSVTILAAKALCSRENPLGVVTACEAWKKEGNAKIPIISTNIYPAILIPKAPNIACRIIFVGFGIMNMGYRSNTFNIVLVMVFCSKNFRLISFASIIIMPQIVGIML